MGSAASTAPSNHTSGAAPGLSALLEARRSVRRFKPDPLPRELIEDLLSAAILAPSASNKQPWRFLVVRGATRLTALAAAVRRETNTVAEHIPAESQPAFRAYGEYFTRFEHAPAVIVPICRGHAVLSQLVNAELPAAHRVAIEHMEQHSAVVSTSLALMNLLLKATELGLGASAMTGPLVADAEVRELLGVRPGWSIVAFVPIGYPNEAPTPTQRKQLGHVVRWLE